MKKINFLKILDYFSFLFTNSDIDYQNVRLLLQLKFNLDRRKVPLGFRNINLKKGKDKNLFIFTLLFYGMMGIFFVMFIAIISTKSALLGSISFFTFLIMFISYAVIIEFSLDMFDTSDREILLPKPVTLKEINLAKNLHILIYMFGIALAFSLPTLIFWGVTFNLFTSLITLVSVIFCLLFLFCVSALFYGILLQKFSGEKLKDIINLVQIASIIFIFLGYQFFMQAIVNWISTLDLSSISNFIYLFPPSWFAMPSYLAALQKIELYPILAALFGFVISVIGYRYYVLKFAPSFEKNLYRLTLNESKVVSTHTTFVQRFSRIFKSNTSKAFYKFSLIMLSRERKIKQAVYPLIAMGVLFPIIMLYRNAADLEVPIYETKNYFLIYFTMMMSLPLSVYVNFSENFKASWLYRFLPVKIPGQIIKSAHFAMLFKYQFIIIIGIGLIYLYIWKFRIIIHVICSILSFLILQMIYRNMAGMKLPFSEELKTGQNSAFKQGSYMLTVFIFTPLVAGLHYLSTFINFGGYLYLIIQLITIYILYRNHYKIDWQDLDVY